MFPQATQTASGRFPRRVHGMAIPPAPARRPVRPPGPDEVAVLVHADQGIAVIAKPAGVSLATPSRQPQAAAERLVQALPPESREPLAGGQLLLVHRLDVGTSGLVVLARDPATHRRLSQDFAERRVVKRYLALAWGRVATERGVVAAPLGPDRRDRRRMEVDWERGKPARTRYRVLATSRHASLLELVPETGRTHQIRVHLASLGHPVVGDDLYGRARQHSVPQGSLRDALSPPHSLLHAWTLVLPAYEGAAGLSFVAALPLAFLRTLRACGMSRPIP